MKVEGWSEPEEVKKERIARELGKNQPTPGRKGFSIGHSFLSLSLSPSHSQPPTDRMMSLRGPSGMSSRSMRRAWLAESGRRSPRKGGSGEDEFIFFSRFFLPSFSEKERRVRYRERERVFLFFFLVRSRRLFPFSFFLLSHTHNDH